MNVEHSTHDHARADQGHHRQGPGYETRDAHAGRLLAVGGGLTLAVVIIHFLMLAFFALFVSERPQREREQPTSNIYQQLRELRRGEEKTLASYDWVDPKSGVVRIPIDRAIDLVADKGVRFGKGPKTEVEMNSHSGTPVPAPAPPPERGAANPEGTAGPKP
jgi:hypothetical protein